MTFQPEQASERKMSLRKIVIWVLLGLGVLSFFLPLVSVKAPLVGKIDWSALNVVSGIFQSPNVERPSFQGIVGSKEDSDSTESHSIPLSIQQAVLFPFAIVLAYLALCIFLTAESLNLSTTLRKPAGILGMVCSLFGLLSIFVLSNGFRQEMSSSLEGAGTDSSAFSGFGRALVQSITIDPGSGLYLLATVMVLLFLVQKMRISDSPELDVTLNTYPEEDSTPSGSAGAPIANQRAEALPTMTIVGVGSILVAALSLGALVYYEYSSDMAAWKQVQQSLTRLTSGIRFEPIITLRSKIADTDAAIKTYQSGFHVFPTGHEAILELGIRGLQYLGIAVDGAKEIESWHDMSKYPEVTKFVPRTCDGDHLAFYQETIKNAFALVGSSLVKEAAGEASDKEIQTRTTGFVPVLVYAKETGACKERYDSAVKISGEKKKEAYAAHLAKWKYHIDVSNPSICLMTAYTDGQEVAPSSFGRFHLDADDEAHLDGVFCSPESPDRVISVTINGAKYEPNWKNDGSTYSAVLVSVGNSPKRKPPPPDTAGGGTPTVPYTSFAMGAGTSTQGGMAVGDAGGGNFGNRFSWYVEAVQRRVSGNWLQSIIDPRISSAPRVIATFDILRDGTITNIQVTKSSGNQSVDMSEVRAIRESSPLDRLPPGYNGSKVSVEFWFDFHR